MMTKWLIVTNFTMPFLINKSALYVCYCKGALFSSKVALLLLLSWFGCYLIFDLSVFAEKEYDEEKSHQY